MPRKKNKGEKGGKERANKHENKKQGEVTDNKADEEAIELTESGQEKQEERKGNVFDIIYEEPSEGNIIEGLESEEVAVPPKRQDELVLRLRQIPEWFAKIGKMKNGRRFSEKYVKLLRLAQKYDEITDIARKLKLPPSTIKKMARSIVLAWNSYGESNGKEYSDEVAEQGGEQVFVAPAVQMAKRPQQGSGSEEKIPPSFYTASAKTTTFKEIDKVLAEALGQTFHRYAVEKEVYARLGELLIFSLLQLGVVTRDDIVRYSEKLIEDPNALYEYVRTQLDAVLRVTDPEALMKTWQENLFLRRKINALEATADMLSDLLKEYEDALRFLISMLNKKQLEKLATYVFMKEALSEWGILEKSSEVV